MSFYPDKWTMNIWFIVSHKGKIWSSIISEIHHDKESVLCMLWRWGLFPKDNKRLKEWMESLSIRYIPPDHARDCAGHFLSHEIDISVTGRRSISHLALPLKGSHQHKKIILIFRWPTSGGPPLEPGLFVCVSPVDIYLELTISFFPLHGIE